jgi:hypothetical protein
MRLITLKSINQWFKIKNIGSFECLLYLLLPLNIIWFILQLILLILKIKIPLAKV